jgi:hypothetical protein
MENLTDKDREFSIMVLRLKDTIKMGYFRSRDSSKVGLVDATTHDLN